MEEKIVNGKTYQIIRLLGHGKGGYSYLASVLGKLVVLKQIHHETCDYYQFGNKIEAELHDYDRLKATGISIPALLDFDKEQEIIIKEYKDGPTIAELVSNHQMKEEYYQQIKSISEKLKSHHLNIDYYPTNFIVENDSLYYIDFECNDYMDEWSYEVWGKQYWY